MGGDKSKQGRYGVIRFRKTSGAKFDVLPRCSTSEMFLFYFANQHHVFQASPIYYTAFFSINVFLPLLYTGYYLSSIECSVGFDRTFSNRFAERSVERKAMAA